METFLQICGGIAGILMLYFGAEWLVGGGVAIARRLRIPPLVVGLTLVAFGTSAPELVVSISASLTGHGDVSIGNVIGSNICNIALILGLCATISPLPVNRNLFKLDMPLMISASAILLLFYHISGGVNRIEGAFLLCSLIIYITWSIFKDRRKTQPEEDKSDKRRINIPLALLMVAGGLTALILGGNFFVGAAVHIARLCKISEAVIGLTVVAVGTSLPELATSAVAAFKGENDIAIGNVVGSNIFNILAILGIAPLISPIYAPNITNVDLGVMMMLALLLYPVMRTGYTISRREGILLLCIYLGYTVWLVCG